MILKLGNRSDYVKELQEALGIWVDGDFGPKTEKVRSTSGRAPPLRLKNGALADTKLQFSKIEKSMQKSIKNVRRRFYHTRSS